MKKKEYREVYVAFTLPGPPGTYSSVSTGFTVGRECSEEEAGELYLEAEAQAMANTLTAYKKLVSLYQKIHGPDPVEFD